MNGTASSLEEIAMKTGFVSCPHLTETFTRFLGIFSPTCLAKSKGRERSILF